jgi:uncharacterized protein (TIGR02117 family)
VPKKILLKIGKYLLISILGFIIFLGIYFLMAFLLSSAGTSPKKVSCSIADKIYLSSNEVHVDLVFPVSMLDSSFVASLHPTDGARYVAFGWGDSGFYLETPTWDDLKYSTVLKALFWHSPAVMHVSFYSTVHPSWASINVCPEQIKLMQDNIDLSFRKVNDVPERIFGFDYGRNDRFFEAYGSYNCFYTCNVWTGSVLKKGKVKTAIWSPFTGGIMYFAGENIKKG